MLTIHCLTFCVKAAGSNVPPAGREIQKAALLRPLSLPDDKTFLPKCESISLGDQHVFVLYGLGGAWKSQTAFKFVDACQVENQDSRYATQFVNFRICTGLMLLSRFSDVFYVDASTKETIIADLKQIALAKGLGESEKATLDWLSGQHKDWLLLFYNADDPTLNLRSYFPRCSHSNVLITSQNCDTCIYAPQFCQVSDMKPEEARDLLLKHARLDNTPETQAPSMTIVKVHLL